VELASSIGDTARMSDEAVMSIMALGLSVAKLPTNKMRQFTEAAIGLAAKTGTSADQMAMLLARATAGGEVSWTRYGIVISRTHDKQKALNQVLQQGTTAFQAMAKAPLGPGGQLSYIQHQINKAQSQASAAYKTALQRLLAKGGRTIITFP